jgi:cob(I)alamin adenosyltransferase
MAPMIYTRTGDEGQTSLACGQRLPKDDLRIEAYGTIDELSSALGVVAALLSKLNQGESDRWMPQVELLEWIQDKLFTLSSMIATANLPAGNLPEVSLEDVEFLERHIDSMETDLPPLKNFILPGGSEVVSFIHLARTICRRAERHCTCLSREGTLNPVILPFLNRLSDELFVLGRWIGYQQGEPEKIWVGRKRPEHQKLESGQKRRQLVEKLLKEDGTEQLTLFVPGQNAKAE